MEELTAEFVEVNTWSVKPHLFVLNITIQGLGSRAQRKKTLIARWVRILVLLIVRRSLIHCIMKPTFFYIAPVEQKEDVTKDRTDAPAGSAAVDKGWKGYR